MPTYEYLCKHCGERFERVQSFSSRSLKTHDACGGTLQKVFHPNGVVFKGPGFYATDNRASARTSADTTSAAKSATSSDGKPDRKTTEPKKESPAAAAAD
jgi:putative FmdB family regulatory protein